MPKYTYRFVMKYLSQYNNPRIPSVITKVILTNVSPKNTYFN
jgi:hypothetical protein